MKVNYLCISMETFYPFLLEKLEEEVRALKSINEVLHESISAINEIYPMFQVSLNHFTCVCVF